MSDSASPALAARLAELRISYESATLTEGDLPAAPLPAFVGWFDAAVDAGLPEPNAMVLSTADSSGAPSSRTVLLKQADPRGFVFFTNLGSRKGRELAENPRASLLFPWIFMQRQVIVTGSAQLIDRDEVAEYWATRPEKSRIGAWASRQSTVLEGRDALERRYAELEERFGDDAPVPDFWGGWLIRADAVEFWQGRRSRLHDRLRFRRLVDDAMLDDPAGWTLERLSP